MYFRLFFFLLPLSPLDSRLEDLPERYNHELEERKRLEAELKIMQVKVSSFVVEVDTQDKQTIE